MNDITVHAFDEYTPHEAEPFGFFNAIGIHCRFGVMYIQREGMPEQAIASFDHYSQRWLLFRDGKHYTDLEVLVNV